jgi:23S rRNA pseudouridine1911/1915/1917 synthase
MYNPDVAHSHNPEQWTIEADQAGQRLDRYIVSRLEDISRTQAQQLISNGLVLVNEHAVKPGYALRVQDTLQVLRTTPLAAPITVQPQALPLDIAYEDEYILVINKASGMVVHPAPGHYEDTLVNALLARYPELRASESDLRPGIVHRLDRDTPGLLIVAKDVRTQAALVEQMKQHEIVKRYLALVEGTVALEKGSIDAPIGRDPRHRQQMTITTVDSRNAVTHFRVLNRYAHHTLLLLQLETGRTHQIRVHLQAIKHHVVGDPVYGSGRVRPGLVVQRQFLHAYQLAFSHPITGRELELEAPLPPDLQSVLANETLL